MTTLGDWWLAGRVAQFLPPTSRKAMLIKQQALSCCKCNEGNIDVAKLMEAR